MPVLSASGGLQEPVGIVIRGMYLRGAFESRQPARGQLEVKHKKKAAPWPPFRDSLLETLQNLYVLCLPALGPLDYVERDRLAFLQAAEAIGLNRRIVNEDVLAILTADEAVALRVIEPLNCSLFHGDAYSFEVM